MLYLIISMVARYACHVRICLYIFYSGFFDEYTYTHLYIAYIKQKILYSSNSPEKIRKKKSNQNIRMISERLRDTEDVVYIWKT